MGNFLRNYVFNNMAFKLVSLAIAILLWWAVGRDQPIEVPLTVPLEFQNAPTNLEINSNYPFEARLTLRGPERLIQQQGLLAKPSFTYIPILTYPVYTTAMYIIPVPHP